MKPGVWLVGWHPLHCVGWQWAPRVLSRALAALFLWGRKQGWRECPQSREKRDGEGAGEPFPGPGTGLALSTGWV